MRERGEIQPSLAGSLLLAHPKLRDPHFDRTVILLSLHNAEGAMGVVLNRPMEKTLGELGTELAHGGLSDVPLYQGGPVNPEQLILVAWETDTSAGNVKLYFGIDPEKLIELRQEREIEVRGFLGYSGWAAGQLENEMKRESWIVAPVSQELVGGLEGRALWRAVVGALSPRWKILADEPDDPERN